MNRRLMIWATVLLAGAAAVYFAPDSDKGIVAPAARTVARQTTQPSPATASARSAPEALEVLAIRPRIAAEEDHEPFAPVAWKSPAPPPSVVKASEEPPPAPQAPPLPFKVVGQYTERDQQGVFLLHNDQNLVVRVGDTIAHSYKVESLQGGVLTLLYLPLQQRQTLPISASN